MGCGVEEEAGLGVPSCSSGQGPSVCTKVGFPVGCCTRMQAGMASADPPARGETTASAGDELKKSPSFSCHWESKVLLVRQLEFIRQIY